MIEKIAVQRPPEQVTQPTRVVAYVGSIRRFKDWIRVAQAVEKPKQ